ncbi:MAG: hypothetical protein R2827_06980 [Bdellovibrionales bacterium]
MKKAVTILLSLALLSSQAMGKALCPSVCESLNKKVAIEESTPPCHASDYGKSMENDKMPDDCSLQVLLETLSVLNISASHFKVEISVNDNSGFLDLLSIQEISSLSLFNKFLSAGGDTPLQRSIRPIFLLNESFLI